MGTEAAVLTNMQEGKKKLVHRSGLVCKERSRTSNGLDCVTLDEAVA